MLTKSPPVPIVVPSPPRTADQRSGARVAALVVVLLVIVPVAA